MGFSLDRFLCCLELQLGGIIMAWWGMIFSAIGVIGMLSGLLFGRNELQRWMPFHISGGNTIVTGIILILIFVVYFYFSYQLLLGSQSGNSSQMFGYLIIHGIYVVLFIIGVFSNVGSLVLAIIYAYLWFCVYSLYVRSGGSGIV